MGGACTYVTCYNISKSYIFDSYIWFEKPLACVLASLAWYKNATVAEYLLELLLTCFKKYHPLFPNYTSAFISSFNCLYQKNHNVIPAAETLPSKCDKTCQTLQKHPAPTESINFFSLWRDLFTDEGYNLGQVAMFTFITFCWNAFQLY